MNANLILNIINRSNNYRVLREREREGSRERLMRAAEDINKHPAE